MKYLKVLNLPIIFVALFYFIVSLNTSSLWQSSRQSGDGLGYYIYLPSVLIHQDLGDFKKTSEALRKYVPNLPDLSEDIYGFRPTPIGKLADKYPIGVALLQSPFFIAAHAYTTNFSTFEPDGFSRPYQVVTFFSTFFYVILGLWFLHKTLLQYYSITVTALTIILLALGTNLLYFTSIFSAMSHGYQFFAVSMLIYFTDKLYNKPKAIYGILMGASFGLVAIIRTQDLILGLIPLLWNVNSFEAFIQRIKFILKSYKIYFYSILAFIIVITTQIVYYKFISGQWIYFSYVGETFNWANPQIINGLFDAKNGWFLYTPLMLPVVLSLLIKTQRMEVWILPLALVLGLHIYISYSWWCWYYIAGMGSRPMVDIYPILSFGLAALLSWLVSNNKIVCTSGLVLLIFLGLQNLKFSYQQFNGIIFSETNNIAYYKSMFLKVKPQKDDIVAFVTNELQPNTNDLTLVDTLFFTNFDNIKENADTITIFSGKASINMETQDINISMMDLQYFNLRNGDWLKVSMDAYIDKDGFWFFNLPMFALEFKKQEDARGIWKHSNPTALINNSSNSIWFTGQPKKWEKVTYFTKVPFTPTQHSTLRILGFNPSKIKWNIDNLNIEIYKNK